MSAYALAGIFPPLPFAFPDGMLCSISTSPQPHSNEHNIDTTEYAYDLGKPDCARKPVVQETNGLSRSKAITVTVKDTKIDSMLLIQLLTTATTSATPLARTNSNSEKPKKLGRRRLSSTLSSEAIDTTEFSSPQELAMQFELDVVHHGQQCTLTRSLHRIRQLSDELMMEELCQDESESDEYTARKSTWSKFSDTYSTLSALSGYGSLSNQSFASLHTLARSYAPDIESWLRKIIGRPGMDRSPMLTNFLSECICPMHQCSSGRTCENDISIVPCLTTISGSSLSIPKVSIRQFRRNSSLESIEELTDEGLD